MPSKLNKELKLEVEMLESENKKLKEAVVFLKEENKDLRIVLTDYVIFEDLEETEIVTIH